jgi:hypothetical protein
MQLNTNISAEPSDADPACSVSYKYGNSAKRQCIAIETSIAQEHKNISEKMNPVSPPESAQSAKSFSNKIHFSRQLVFASLFALVAVASAAPQGQDRPIAIISQNSNQEADGSYQHK